MFSQYRGGRQLEQLGKQKREESVRDFLIIVISTFLYKECLDNDNFEINN